MRLNVVPTDESHLPYMARILAARHRIHRMHNPALPMRFEDAEYVEPLLRQGLQTYSADSAVALAGDRLVGFLQGRVRSDRPDSPTSFFWRPHSVSMPLAAHAAEPEFVRDAFAAMYAFLSRNWVCAGILDHFVFVPPHDQAAIETWFSLNFGLYWTYAIRDTSPLPAPRADLPSELSIRRLDPCDREQILSLLDEVYTYHSLPPCFMPVPHETAEGVHARNEQAVVDPGTLHWVAEYQGNVVGVIVVNLPQTDETDSAIAKPKNCPYIHLAITVEHMRGQGIGTALLNTVLGWSRDQGYANCSLDYHPPSFESSRFWEDCGFKPVRHGLVRRIDERVVETF